jgi:hypothetical protein
VALVVPAVSGEELIDVLRLAGFGCVARSPTIARMESDELVVCVPLVRELGSDDFRRVLLAARLTASHFLELLASTEPRLSARTHRA